MPITVEESLTIQNDEHSRNEKVYYPNNIGYPAPRLNGQYEFVLMGIQDQEQEALPKVMKIFDEQKAKVISLSFFNDQSPSQFVMDIVVDLSSARCNPTDLAARLTKLKKFVKIVEMGDSKGRIFGRFLFPLTFFGTVRALAIDSDRFTRLFSKITRELGDKAKRVLYEDGHSEGNEIVEAIKEFFTSGEEQKNIMPNAADEGYVLENAKAFLRSAGWGSFEYSKMTESDMYCVTVLDPPTDAEGGIVLGNYFLHGMLSGIIEPLLGSRDAKLTMMNESYDEDTRTLTLYYINKNILELDEERENLKAQHQEEQEPPLMEETIPKPLEEKKEVIHVMTQLSNGMQVQQMPPPPPPPLPTTTITTFPPIAKSEHEDHPAKRADDEDAKEQIELVIKSIDEIQSGQPAKRNYEAKPNIVKEIQPAQRTEATTTQSKEKTKSKDDYESFIPNLPQIKPIVIKKGKTDKKTIKKMFERKRENSSDSEDNFWM